MAAFSLLSVYRLLGIAVLCYLQFFHEVNAQNRSRNNVSTGSLDEFNHRLRDSRSQDDIHSSGSRIMGRIEASVIPNVNSNGSENENRHSPKVHSRAEVRVLVPTSHKNPDPHADGLIRASSILMEFDEDTRKYVHPEDPEGLAHHHHIRHSSHKNLSPKPLSDDYFAANDAPLDETDAVQRISSTPKYPTTAKTLLRRPISLTNQIPVQLKDGSFSSRSPSDKSRQEISSGTVPRRSAFKPHKQNSWIAFHSPVRIYIPVRYNEVSRSSANSVDTNCVQCSPNITIMAPQGETRAEVPVPAISICHRLARQRRPINVAVTAGPRPGTRIPEGHYPIELAVWKANEHVYSCQYSLDVIVKKCKDVFPPTDGFVDCSHGTIWGSKCNFSCSTNYELQGHRTVVCEGNSNDVSWSSSFPKCKKTPYKYISVKSLPCMKPPKPSDGTVVCDSNGQSMYPDGSVCQFFCYPGFLIENLLTSSTLIVCKNGQWTPNSNVQCIATYCSEPRHPQYGLARCDDKDVKDSAFKFKYKNGTSCHFQCDTGYVIPKSQQHLNKIICHAPHWNDSSIPECKQKFIPQPYSRDCKNMTLTANRRGYVKIKPPRFYLKSSTSTNKIYGNCTLNGKISVGVYINRCSVHNPELNTIGHCTYHIIVKENSCSALPVVPHSQLLCDNEGTQSFPRGTICKYTCKDGFVMPLRQRKFESKTCTSKLKWRSAVTPNCKRSIPPKPRKNSCISQTIFLQNNEISANLKLPRFRTSLKGSKVKVKCSLNGTLSVGQYVNHCEAVDKQLGLSSSCTYNITVQAIGCHELLFESPLSSNCSNKKIGGHFPLGTLCNYKCKAGLVIPSSVLPHSIKMCIAHQQWNSSVMPTCVNQTLPVPSAGYCLNKSATVEDVSNLAVYQVDVPEFKSSSGVVIDADCKPQTVAEYGLHNISCTAFDPELRLYGFCSFGLEILKSNDVTELSREAIIGCLELPMISSGSQICLELKREEYFPIGTICSFECEKGYVIPTDFLSSSIKKCIGHEQWNSSMLPICVYQSPPVPEVDSCLDYSAVVEDLATFQVGTAKFRSSSGTVIQADCEPQNITEYTVHNVNCTAFDSILRVHGFCSFQLDVQTPSSVAALAGDVAFPVLISGCEDYALNVSDLSLINVSLPTFVTSQNTSAFVTCDPETFTEYRQHEILCTAHDKKLGSSMICKFYIDLLNYSTEALTRDSTTEYLRTSSSIEIPFAACKNLEPPSRGSINCTSEPTKHCSVSCDDSYEFSSEYQLLNLGGIECDGVDGLWDFERMYSIHLLPGCLGRLQNTSVAVLLSFTANVERCDDDYQSELQKIIKDLLISKNEEMCHLVNCDNFNVTCSEDALSNRYLLNSTWNLQADFNPMDFEDSDEVPDAEINIETILDVTQKEINQEKFKDKLLESGVELHRSSYHQSHFFMECQKDGYAVDLNTNKCVECPPGTMESNNRCLPCERDHFQLAPGQTSCDVCPHPSFWVENKPETCSD